MRMSDKSNQPRGRGRPATGETPKRYFRADDELWSQISAAAEHQNESVSGYIRRVLARDAKRVNKSNGERGLRSHP